MRWLRSFTVADNILKMNRVQLMVQIGVFVSLFLVMFDTYPLRVGLAEMLTSKYLTVCTINAIYFLMTATVYGYRAVSSYTTHCSEREVIEYECHELAGILMRASPIYKS